MATAAIGLGLSALSGLGGLFSKPKPITTTSNQSQQYDSMNRPIYDDNVLQLRNQLVNANMSQLENEGDYWSGYAREGMGNLAQGGAAANRYIQNLLASRGIRGGAAGSALAMPAINQQQQQSSFLNNIPGLADQRRRAILGETMGFLSSLPFAQQQTGTSSGTSTSTQTGGTPGGVGNFLGGMAPTLAGLWGMGAFNGNKGSSSGGSVPFLPSNRQISPYLNPNYGSDNYNGSGSY